LMAAVVAFPQAAYSRQNTSCLAFTTTHHPFYGGRSGYRQEVITGSVAPASTPKIKRNRQEPIPSYYHYNTDC
jgi:hypothetical protein